MGYDFFSTMSKFGTIILIILVIALVLLVAWSFFYFGGLWKLFKKAGKSGWEAIIPFYNIWTLVEISGLAWWWFLLIAASYIVNSLEFLDYIPKIIVYIANLVGSFCCYYNLSKKFHQEVGFAILMTLFPGIALPLMGFINSFQFDANVAVSDMGPFGGKSTQSSNSWDNTSNGSFDKRFCTNCGAQVNQSDQFCTNCGQSLK